MSQTLLLLAGFQVILIGRFWVIAEAPQEFGYGIWRISPSCQASAYQTPRPHFTRGNARHNHQETEPVVVFVQDQLHQRKL